MLREGASVRRLGVRGGGGELEKLCSPCLEV